MRDEKSITRREALKKMGAVAAGVGLGIGGIYAADVLGLSDKEEKRKKNARTPEPAVCSVTMKEI